MTAPFALAVYSHRHPARLVVVGELDTDSAPELEATFRAVAAAHGAENVRIDLSALDFCDSGAWRALERCRDRGAELYGSPPCLRRLHYLIKHAHLLPPELHELRGLEPEARAFPAVRAPGGASNRAA
jgi:ABC-type transporter Mla MlaB component